MPRQILKSLTSPRPDAWRDAARAALQGAVAAASTFLLMRLMGLSEIFVGVLSAVFILQPSIGGTASSAGARLVATLVGTTAGLVTLLALPYEVGKTLALALSVFLVSGLASFRSDWTYGLVAAVGISLASEVDPFQTAVNRATAIAFGAGLGILVSLVVWPERSRTRREKHFHRVLRAVRDRTDDAVATAAGHGKAEAKEIAPRYNREMALAREADAYTRVRGDGEDERLAAVRRLYNATIIVDRADEVLSRDRSVLHDMDEQVRDVRKELSDALDRILTGKNHPRELLISIDRTLQSLTERSIDCDQDKEAVGARLALTFGLKELRTSLGALVDTLEDQDR